MSALPSEKLPCGAEQVASAQASSETLGVLRALGAAALHPTTVLLYTPSSSWPHRNYADNINFSSVNNGFCYK